MTTAVLFGCCAAITVGLGLYGVTAHPQPLRKIIAVQRRGQRRSSSCSAPSPGGGRRPASAATRFRRRWSSPAWSSPSPPPRSRSHCCCGWPRRLHELAAATSRGRPDPPVAMCRPLADTMLASPLLVLADRRPGRGRAARLRDGRPVRQAHRAPDHPGRPGVAIGDRRRSWRSVGPLVYLLGDWAPPLGSRVARGRAVGGHAGVSAVVLGVVGVVRRATISRVPAGDRNARAVRLLDLAAGGLGAVSTRSSWAATSSPFTSRWNC